MEQLASDLRAWLELDARTPPNAGDTSDMWKALREAAAPRLTEAQKQADELQCIRASARRLQELLDPLHADIRDNFAAAEFNAKPEGVKGFFNYNLIRGTSQEDFRATIISGPGWNPICLVIAVAVATKDDGHLHYQGVYYLGMMKGMGGHIDNWESTPAAADCGSIELEAGLSGLAHDIIEAFPEWLRKLNEALAAK